MKGNQEIRICLSSEPCSGGSPTTSTLLSSSVPIIALLSDSGLKVTKPVPLSSLPVIFSP